MRLSALKASVYHPLMANAVSVASARKTFGDLKAVDGLSFSVPRATCFGLLGPNGAGKTTMMKMLTGRTWRDKDPETRIDVLGFDPLEEELEIKVRTGIVPQEDNLDEELTVRQNLEVYGRFYGMERSRVRERIAHLLEFMDLSGKEKARIKQLSGGMKRRLIIARSLLNEPELLILDEPTTGLDPQVRHHIWDRLRSLKTQGVTILLTTHYMEEAFQLCDDLIIMDKGKDVLRGRPATLVAEHMEPWVLEIVHSGDTKARVEQAEGLRIEDAGHRTLVYARELDVLEQLRRTKGDGDYFLRQTNLEDLFLKSTGRRLNDGQ